MSDNKELVAKFYIAFQQLNAAEMNSFYSDDVVFFDPVFGLLKGVEVNCMWEMLCKNARNFSLTYNNINALDDEYCTCDWVATYTFSGTGKTVVNKVKANMLIGGGKILEHSDAFSLHKWSTQALGVTGRLFGWNTLFQNKIKNQAKKNLLKFMETKR